VAIEGTDNSTNGSTADTVTVRMYANADELSGGAWGTRDCTGGFAKMGTLVANAILVTNAFAWDSADEELECTGSFVDEDGDLQTQTAPLLANIEDFQVLYGVDADNPGDQSVDLYTATPADWNRVFTARVCVLIRSENTGVTTGQQTYRNCAGALGTAANAAAAVTTATDTHLRRAFVATFNIRSRISRLP
jgi:type IV pilus assembly protein PilW